MTAATYIVVYETASGNTNTEYIESTSSQKAVDYIRKWEGDSVFIITVAKVVSNWK